MLLRTFLEISAEWRACFPQQRTHLRALRQGLGGLVCVGRRTLARIIWTNGRRAAQLERRVFFCTRDAAGSRNSCSSRSGGKPCRFVAGDWSAWRSMKRGCARRAARSDRRFINAIRSRRRFTPI